MLVFYFMEILKWVPVFYNGLETNVEVTKCGQVRKVKVDWYGNTKGAYQIKYGEIEFDKLKLHKNGYKQVLIQIKELSYKMIFVHQLVASAFLNYKFQGHKLVVDHIDSNKLNNHVDNLKIVTSRENISKERALKKLLPIGVWYYKRLKKYRAAIKINGKSVYLGVFTTVEDASNAYQNKLKSLC